MYVISPPSLPLVQYTQAQWAIEDELSRWWLRFPHQYMRLMVEFPVSLEAEHTLQVVLHMAYDLSHIDPALTGLFWHESIVIPAQIGQVGEAIAACKRAVHRRLKLIYWLQLVIYGCIGVYERVPPLPLPSCFATAIVRKGLA